jgi:hypothetical protein
MLKRINLQLFAGDDKPDEKLKDDETEKPTNDKGNSIEDKLDKLINMLTPKDPPQTVKQIVVPEKPILNPEEQKEEEKKQEGETLWQKINKILWS